MKTKVVIFSLLFLLSSGKARSEEVNLEKIVVTPSRTEEEISGSARNVDVITAGDIEKSQAEDVSQALTGLTSVDISDYGGLGATKTIRIRGSTAAQVLVMVDGRPINSPRDGEVELSAIPVENIERIEVVHGPGSSLYGAGAMGGIVNIITKRPPEEGSSTELTTSFGTFRTYLERLSHGARIGKAGYLVTGEYESSAGFRDNSDFRAKDLNAKFEYSPDDNNKLMLSSGFYRSDAGTPFWITAPDLDDRQRNLKNFQDLNWQFKPTDRTELSAKIYQNYDRLEFMENTPDFTKDIHVTTTRGLDLQHSYRFTGAYQAVYGFNYVTNFNDSTASAKHDYIVRAGYLENRLDLFEKLNLDFGARLDDYSTFGNEISPNFSFRYALARDFKLRGLISRSFRAPTFNDLYWPRKDYYYGGFWIGAEEGNPNLKPERGITGELGIEADINRFISSGLTFYRSDYNDLITWVDESGVWKPKNINSAVIDGIEFQNKIRLTDRLGLDLNYSFLRAKDDKTHKDLIYRPRHKVDFSLNYSSRNGFALGLDGQFVGQRFHVIDDPFDGTVKVKQFFVLGLHASKKIKPGVTCALTIDNLLNRKYQVIRNYPKPGFFIAGILKLEI